MRQDTFASGQNDSLPVPGSHVTARPRRHHRAHRLPAVFTSAGFWQSPRDRGRSAGNDRRTDGRPDQRRRANTDTGGTGVSVALLDAQIADLRKTCARLNEGI